MGSGWGGILKFDKYVTQKSVGIGQKVGVTDVDSTESLLLGDLSSPAGVVLGCCRKVAHQKVRIEAQKGVGDIRIEGSYEPGYPPHLLLIHIAGYEEG